jgi:hypothetical protein
MLQESSRSESALPAESRPYAAEAAGGLAGGNTGALVGELRRLGLEPRLMRCGQGLTAGGAALQLSLAGMAASPELAAQLMARLRRALLQRVPTSLTLCDAGSGRCGFEAIERLCAQLDALLSAPCIDRRRLGVGVHAGDLPLPAFRLLSRVLLGHGSRHLFLDAAHLALDSGAADDAASAAIWSGLYLQRKRSSRMLPVYGGGVRTRCPLLGDEASGALLPQGSILVPPDTAWLPLDVFLGRYADARGELREQALCRALQTGLLLADRLFDRLCWPDQLQYNDACLNRRIAVTLHGIGDLVAVRGEDPASLDCLRTWDRLLGRIHQWLWDRSHDLATLRGLLPALACRNPSHQWSDDKHRRDWRKRWREALKTDAVRHRNLLVLSPYELLPRCGANAAAASACTELLPLLAHADACSFAGAPSFAGWSISEFKHFHCRAFAIMRRRNAARFVAAGA